MIPSTCNVKAFMLSVVSAAVAAAGVAPPSIAQLPIAPGMMPPNLSRPVFKGTGSGNLEGISKSGKKVACPLKHTAVTATVSGHISRVTVKQLFENPLNDKIEAVYTFPLSDTGAVDDMLMKVGERTIHGTIKKREEARQIYEAARASGHVAALLDQERPNIFTQSVANIEPNKDVEVTISYVDMLPYEAGTYTFAFPTVVGPRFNPGSATGKQGLGFAPDTTEVPDASKITPHVAPQGQRAGHDISISVSIDSPVSISNVRSALHEVRVAPKGDRHADVSLIGKSTIPNKDFVLTWAVSTDQVRSGYLTNAKDGEGFFNVSIMPPKKPKADQVQPKEMIFLIDCSGSQRGMPLQKAKETMFYVLDHMNDDDTFQVISFNNGATELFSKPEKATGEMRKRAHTWIAGLEARGGTWMGPAIEKACAIPADSNRLRIVTFMTDGFVGNDFQIIGMVKKLRGTSRWFPFGTGNSVNRFLIDNMAKEGGGEADYVYLNSSAEEAGKKFYNKIASPVLTDVKVEFEGLSVKEVFPKEVSDVWAERPLYITGRYTKSGKGKVKISGFSGGKPYHEELTVDFPASNAANNVLPSLWARAKVDRLMAEDWMGAQSGAVNKELRDEIVETALKHHIMTQYTSFVAVEEQHKTKDGKLITVEVPVELADGVSREGVFGEAETRGPRTAGLTAAGVPYGMGSPVLRRAASGGGGGAPYVMPQKKDSAASMHLYGGPSNSVGGVSAGYGSANIGVPAHYAAGAYKPAPAQSVNRARAQWFNSPREVSIVDERPIVVDHRSAPWSGGGKVASVPSPEVKQESGKAVSSLEKQSAFEQSKDKLSADLKQWLDDTVGGATVKVLIKLAPGSDSNLLRHARIKGMMNLKTSKTSRQELEATITREALGRLLQMKEVLSVSKM